MPLIHILDTFIFFQCRYSNVITWYFILANLIRDQPPGKNLKYSIFLFEISHVFSSNNMCVRLYPTTQTRLSKISSAVLRVNIAFPQTKSRVARSSYFISFSKKNKQKNSRVQHEAVTRNSQYQN